MTPLQPPPAARAWPGALPLALVAGGAALGALLRWWLGRAVGTTDFPGVTLAINVVGCCLLAALPVLIARSTSPHLPLMLGPGFLGGFTTVSSWAEQSRELAAEGALGWAGLYVVATLVTCAGAAVAGRLLARSATGPRP